MVTVPYREALDAVDVKINWVIQKGFIFSIYFATYNKLSEGEHLKKYYDDKYKNFPPDIDREIGKEYVFRV